MARKIYKCMHKPCPGASAPHQNGMCELAGVNELRDAVKWANATPEHKHDNLNAEQLLARFRKQRDEDKGT
jgi:hypothetical protein